MTGLQWAVLSAYARTLPEGSEVRRAIDAVTARAEPTPGGKRVALTVARAAGMVDGHRITPTGILAAATFLPRLGIDPAKKGA